MSHSPSPRLRRWILPGALCLAIGAFLISSWIRSSSAALTFDSTGVTSDGNLTLNGTAAGTVTIGGNATTGPITVGSVSAQNVSVTDDSWSVSAAGAATFASVNKLVVTAPTTSATLTVADGKTFAANNALTLAGTDGTTMTFPSATATLAGLGVVQTWTAAQTFSGLTSTGSVTLSGAVLQNASPLVFEGGTADDSETTIAVTDPTADRTITIPNATGTLELRSTVVTKTSSYTVTAAEHGTTFTNSGAANAVTFTLPDAVAGLRYTFVDGGSGYVMLVDAQAADQIVLLTNNAGDSITSDTTGQTVTLLAIDSTSWVPISCTASIGPISAGNVIIAGCQRLNTSDGWYDSN